MTIYDISQEVFSCRVYPGDPAPERRRLSSMEEGGLYNLTEDADQHLIDEVRRIVGGKE